MRKVKVVVRYLTNPRRAHMVRKPLCSVLLNRVLSSGALGLRGNISKHCSVIMVKRL